MRTREKNNNDFVNNEGFHEWTERANRRRSSEHSQPEQDYNRSSSSDYDFNRAGFRGDSSGFSGQGRNGVSRSDYSRTDYASPHDEQSQEGRFSPPYSESWSARSNQNKQSTDDSDISHASSDENKSLQ